MKLDFFTFNVSLLVLNQINFFYERVEMCVCMEQTSIICKQYWLKNVWNI